MNKQKRKCGTVVFLSLFLGICQVSAFGQSAPKTKQTYDPRIGQLIETPDEQQKTVYDPNTGERITGTKRLRFDPNTGLPLAADSSAEQQERHSLLSQDQKLQLIKKGLKITSLNGRPIKATLLDISNQGLVYAMTRGPSAPQVMAYGQIMSIGLEGNYKGIRTGLKNGWTSTMACVAVPAALAVVSGNGEILVLGLVAAPVVGFSTFILSALSKDRYLLQMSLPPDDLMPQVYQRQQLLSIISLYLVSGFP